MDSKNLVYDDLINGIIKQAADDYRKALKGRGYGKKSAEVVIREVEQFFHSRYFELLTKADGDYLIERLKQEHLENERSEQPI
jgi:hypothetical protein